MPRARSSVGVHLGARRDAWAGSVFNWQRDRVSGQKIRRESREREIKLRESGGDDVSKGKVV